MNLFMPIATTVIAIILSACGPSASTEPAARGPALLQQGVSWANPEAGPVHAASTEDGSVSVTSDVSQAFVRANADNKLYYLISLHGENATSVERLPKNISLVIDRSGSMAAEDKLGYAKLAAYRLLEKLSHEDYVSVVAYDDIVHTLVPPQPFAHRERIESLIRALSPGNSTNLYAGMTAGFEQVRRNYADSRLNRVVLLSDGLANTGVAEPRAIWEKAEWFRARGVGVTTIGLGVDYDEVLMLNIAESSGGNYYYVRQPQSLAEILESELDEMNRIVARNLTVSVKLGRDIELANVYGYAFDVHGDEARIRVSDMVGGETKKILLEIKSPPQSSGSFTLASTHVRYDDVVDGVGAVATTDAITVAATPDDTLINRSRNRVVTEKRELVQNALTQQEAIEQLQQGERELAKRLLLERAQKSAALNANELHSDQIHAQLEAMEQLIERIETTEGDRVARRDLEIGEQLRALGYIQ